MNSIHGAERNKPTNAENANKSEMVGTPSTARELSKKHGMKGHGQKPIISYCDQQQEQPKQWLSWEEFEKYLNASDHLMTNHQAHELLIGMLDREYGPPTDHIGAAAEARVRADEREAEREALLEAVIMPLKAQLSVLRTQLDQMDDERLSWKAEAKAEIVTRKELMRATYEAGQKQLATALLERDTARAELDIIEEDVHKESELLAGAQARIEELEKDRDRLDWLDVYADNCENLRQGWSITASGEHEGKTLRQAIDAAMMEAK